MATLSGDDEGSAGEDSAGQRHTKFKCAYKQKLSTSTCETDSAAQSDISDTSINPLSPELKVKEKDQDVYSELSFIKEELQSQRKANAEMQQTMKEVLDECKKLTTLYADMKFEMLSLKGEEKVSSGKYMKNKASMKHRRKTSPSSLISFSPSATTTENAHDEY